MKYIIYIMFFLSVACYATERDPKVVRQFQKTHICPSTGQYGRCSGWIVDHVKPLCAGGADNAETNMQYQSKADALAKDKLEWKLCRSLKK